MSVCLLTFSVGTAGPNRLLDTHGLDYLTIKMKKMPRKSFLNARNARKIFCNTAKCFAIPQNFLKHNMAVILKRRHRCANYQYSIYFMFCREEWSQFTSIGFVTQILTSRKPVLQSKIKKCVVSLCFDGLETNFQSKSCDTT